MTPKTKLSLYFSLQILSLSLLFSILTFSFSSSAAIISVNVSIKTFSMVGIYLYTLGFGIAAVIMLTFRKNSLPFYLNQGLNKIQLLLTSYIFCLVSGLFIQFSIGSLG